MRLLTTAKKTKSKDLPTQKPKLLEIVDQMLVHRYVVLKVQLGPY